MSSNEEKNKILDKIYYDPAGYGSVKNTYKEARVKDKTINMEDVQNWFSKNVTKTKQPNGTNSFVAPEPYYEYQMDLFFIRDLKKQKFSSGLVCIDVFTKFATVVPLQGKNGENSAMGIIQAIEEMGKKPKIIYTDGETGFDTYALRDYFVKEGIKHYMTRAHAHMAERFIRTYKALLYARMDSVKNTSPVDLQWNGFNYAILLTYNFKLIHSSTKMTPNDARKTTNEADVKNNLELRAKKNRTYPPLNIGDTVRIQRKRKPNEKERNLPWSPDTYEVRTITEHFGQKYYRVGPHEYRDYIRAELLKV
jgi:hypothetical protein